MLTPVVKWAQNGSIIDLTIDLSDVKSPDIELTQDALHFRGFGHGAQGEDVYQVEISFYDVIDREKSSYNVSDRKVTFKLMKSGDEEWPRLLKEKQKPVWLKVDFEKWKFEDSDDESKLDLTADQENALNQMSFGDKGFEKTLQDAKDDMVARSKLGWLTAFNFMQIFCFNIVIGRFLHEILLNGFAAHQTAFDKVSDTLITVQIFALGEIIHALIGVSKVSVRKPLLSIGFSNLILFLVVLPNKDMRQTRSVFLTTIVWALHRIVVCTENIFSYHEFKHKLFSFVLTSHWVVVFPAVIISTGVVIFEAISIADGKDMSYPLPYNLESIVNVSMLLKVLLFLYAPCCIYYIKQILRRMKWGKKKRMKKE